VTIFIKPPSLDELRRRLESRGTESEQWVCERMKRAAMEIQFAGKCDHMVLNDNLDEAVEETLSLVRKFLETRNAQAGRSRVASNN
jgi:guanylate kinase